MNEDVRGLLQAAGPTVVPPLDVGRAVRRGRRRRYVRTAGAASAVAACAALLVVPGGMLTRQTGVTVMAGPDDRTDQALLSDDLLAGAGCAYVAPGAMDRADHWDPSTAPPSEAIYDVPLPAGGPHLAVLSPVPERLPAEALDVRAVVHNLEHGAVAVWIDMTTVDTGVAAAIDDWARTLRRMGFASDAGGAIVVSPAPGLRGVAPVSLRAWGVAIDCRTWDRAVGDAFVATYFGDRGDAPEGHLAPFPDAN